MIDMRSDTITKPTDAMRQAIAAAEVGDDVHGDDPTVVALERRTAAILGKEAAVYMPSGTMTNQVALRTHTQPGQEIILEEHSHTFAYEAGAPAALSGVMIRTIRGDHGMISPEQVVEAIRPRDDHFPETRLVGIENTLNAAGGVVYPLQRIADLSETIHEHGLIFHLDGARLWNASVASGIPEAEYAQHFDSVSVCFSKGLGAPVGSALAGPASFIERARRFRKQFGGGMRQAGIIAAGALYAVEHHRDRLADDHANARALAEAISKLPDIDIDMSTVQTNIIYCYIPSRQAPARAQALYDLGVHVLALEPNIIRAVTSLAVTAEDIQQVIEAFGKAFNG